MSSKFRRNGMIGGGVMTSYRIFYNVGNLLQASGLVTASV